MEVFREILFLIVMAWSIPNLIFFLIKLIKKNPKIFPIIISVIISIVGLVFSITFLKNIDFFETIGKKDISEKETTNNKNSIGGDDYYWLQVPKLSYKLKLNEEVKIPIKICTPNEVHLKQIKKEMSNKIFDKNIIELSNAEKKKLDEAFSTFLTVKKSLNYQTHDIEVKTEQEEKILEINEFFIDENTKTYSIKALKNGNAVIWFYIGDISTYVLISVEEE